MNHTVKFTEPFKAYKGFNRELKCKGLQFTIGEVAEKPEKDEIRMCSPDAFHYCRNLKQVFSHYRRNGENRFCEIEVLGNYREDNDKGATTKFRIIRELDAAFFKEFDKDLIEEKLGLSILRELQTKYPTFHVGGSTGLFLHGLYLKRWGADGGNGYGNSDLDLVAPYFILPEDFGDYTIEYKDAKASGNDFDETFFVNTKSSYCKVDYRIDPKQRYEVIEYKGFKYKVSALETIIEAKVRYSLSKFGAKHKEDMYELLGKKQTVKKPETDLYGNEVPF